MKFFDKLKKDQLKNEVKPEQDLDLLLDENEEDTDLYDVPDADEAAYGENDVAKKTQIEYTPDQDDMIGDIFAELMADGAKAEGSAAEDNGTAADADFDQMFAEAISQDEAHSDEGTTEDSFDDFFANAADDEQEPFDEEVPELDLDQAEEIDKADDLEKADELDDAEADEPLLDDEDALLMAALGYGDAADRAYTQKSAAKPSSAPQHTDLFRAFAFDGHEYRSKDQQSSIKDAYAKERLLMYIRAGGTLIFTLLLFIYDCFGKNFSGAFDPLLYPTVNVLMSFQILVLACALSAKQLWDGLKGIIKVDPRPYSMASLVVLLTAIYNITLAALGVSGFTLYNFPAALCLVFCVAYDYLNLEREIDTFNKICSWDGICTLEREDSAALAAEMGCSAENVGRAFKLRRGDAPDNYFHRLNRRNAADKIYNYIIAPVLALAMVIFIVSLAANRGFLSSYNIFITVIQFAVPSFMAIASVVPFFTLARFGLGKKAVILNEAYVRDYSEMDTVVFDEREAFGEGSLAITRFSLCDNARAGDIYSIIEDVSIIFDKVGGTAAEAFKDAVQDGAVSAEVDVKSVTDKGIYASVGGRNYIIGSEEYLESYSILVSKYSDREFIESTIGGVVLHVALDGVEVVKLYMTYSIEKPFAEMAKELSARGIKAVLRTRDPNIDDKLIASMIGELEHPISVIHVSGEASDDVQTVDGGLLADGADWSALLKAQDSGEIYRKWSRINIMISGVFLVIGILVAALLGALGTSIGMSPLYIVLFQFIAILPSVVISKLLLD